MAGSSETGARAESGYTLQSRAERLIAAGRVVLAAFSLLAIGLDPSEPPKYAGTTYTGLSLYVGYAALLAVLVWRSEALRARLRLATHVLDLGAFSVFMYLTEGPTSPFFVYFVFSLICATLRWQWRGTLWTAVAALGIFLGMGAYAADVLRDPAFELNRFIIRSVYLAVVAALLGYLGAHERRIRRELSKLAAWPRTAPRLALVRDGLEHAAGVLGAPRVLLAWEEREEPWLHLAWWSRGGFDRAREPPGKWEPLVAEPLAGTDFLCPDARAPVPAVLHTSAEGLRRWHGPPLHPGLGTRFAVGPVLSVGLRGESFEGRLFWLDKPGLTSDDLTLSQIVARQLAASLDQLYLLRRLRGTAVAEERVRLARDLHDGLLQSLTVARLQLETARACLVAEKPDTARQSLEETAELIATEQRHLRAFIQDLKPVPPDGPAGLVARLGELGKSVERQWCLGVELETERLATPIPETLADHIYFIVREALVNAARHAGASAVRVELDGRDGRARVIVADDGRGFPFRGRYEHAALAGLELGPVSLRERVASLGGSLAIDSTESGARLEITLPLVPPEPLDGH